MIAKEVRYPEHEKQRLVLGKAEIIGEFLEWLGEQGKAIAEWEKRGDFDQMWPDGIGINQRLADYFSIDLKVIEKEKQQMLEEIRNGQERNG